MRQACSKPVVGLRTSLTASKTSLQTIRLRINLQTAIVSQNLGLRTCLPGRQTWRQ